MREQFCEHFFSGHTQMHTHTYTEYMSVYWVPSCSIILVSYWGSWSKKYESHWFNTRPIPVLMFQKKRLKSKTTAKQQSPSKTETHTQVNLAFLQSPGRHGIPILAISSGSLACASHHRRPRAAASWRRILGMMSDSCFMTIRQRRILGNCIWGKKKRIKLFLGRDRLLIM